MCFGGLLHMKSRGLQPPVPPPRAQCSILLPLSTSMATMTPFRVPDGYAPPLAVISDTDLGGSIIIVTSIGLAMATLSTIIRTYVKLISRQQAGPDDILLAAGTLVAFAQESVILAACARGLGRSVDLLEPSALESIEKSVYSSQILAVVALGLCKCSVMFFIARLAPKSHLKKTVDSMIVASLAWTIAGVFAFSLQCDLSTPWSLVAGPCRNMGSRVLSIRAFDIALELALFVAAILLVAKLQTSMKKKVAVVLAFGLRLPIVAFIGARMATFVPDQINFARAESLYLIWTVTEINYSLISATLPIFRPFIRDLATFYGASEYSSGSRSQSYSQPLSSFRTRRSIPAKESVGRRGSLLQSRDKDGSTKEEAFHEPHADVFSEIPRSVIRVDRTVEIASTVV